MHATAAAQAAQAAHPPMPRSKEMERVETR